jgi:hypothetical protein
MSTKIAVAIVHGVGITKTDFADEMIEEIKQRFTRETGIDAGEALVFRPVYWGHILQQPEDELWRRMKQGGELDFTSLRRFMVSFAADALAYQPAEDEKDKYEEIHAVYAREMCWLADNAGPDAPLVVVAHSLGTIITSNYFYDLSKFRRLVGEAVRAEMNTKRTALERGETLTCLYTLGSPLALWSLRYDDYGRPIEVPSPVLGDYHPGLLPHAGWENYYDPDDIIGYPLKSLNPAYTAAVKRDVPVNAGGLLTSWNPGSHIAYWEDNDVTVPITKKLADLWHALGA